MSNKKHAPESWELLKISTGWQVVKRGKPVKMYDTKFNEVEPHEPVEIIYQTGVSPEDTKRAKLIAAAPNMLEALKEAKRMYEKLQPAGGWQGVYEEICAAINKAGQ